MSFIGNTTNTYSIGLGLSGISMNDYTASTSGGHADDEIGKFVYNNNDGSTCGNYASIVPSSVLPVSTIANQVEILPNPAASQLTIRSTNEPIIIICIANLLGQVVYTQQPNATKTQLGVSALQAGIYFIKVNNIAIQNFVKE